MLPCAFYIQERPRMTEAGEQYERDTGAGNAASVSICNSDCQAARGPSSSSGGCQPPDKTPLPKMWATRDYNVDPFDLRIERRQQTSHAGPLPASAASPSSGHEGRAASAATEEAASASLKPGRRKRTSVLCQVRAGSGDTQQHPRALHVAVLHPIGPLQVPSCGRELVDGKASTLARPSQLICLLPAITTVRTS